MRSMARTNLLRALGRNGEMKAGRKKATDKTAWRNVSRFFPGKKKKKKKEWDGRTMTSWKMRCWPRGPLLMR